MSSVGSCLTEQSLISELTAEWQAAGYLAPHDFRHDWNAPEIKLRSPAQLVHDAKRCPKYGPCVVTCERLDAYRRRLGLVPNITIKRWATAYWYGAQRLGETRVEARAELERLAGQSRRPTDARTALEGRQGDTRAAQAVEAQPGAITALWAPQEAD